MKKINCLSPVVKELKDITLCSKVFTDKSEQERCYNKLSWSYDRMIIAEAFEKKDLSLCDKLYNKSLVSQCKSMKF